MRKGNFIDYLAIYSDLIDNQDINEVIKFAKEYNIFQESKSETYDYICNKIKARLDSEGLSHETVRPE